MLITFRTKAAGPITDEVGWAAALLALGGAVALAGKRRGYRRMH